MLALTVLGAACLTVAGCGQKAAEQPQYTLRSAELFGEEFSHGKAQLFFAQKVSELTNGKVKVDVFLNGKLGNEKSYCEQLRMGSLDFAKVAASNLAPFVPEFNVFAMPYLVRDLDHLYKIFDSPAGKMLEAAAEKQGFVVLAYWDMNTQNIYNTKRPIVSPKDLVGLKLRTRDARVAIESMAALGAAPEPAPTPELYTLLQTGVFDGGDHDPTVVTSLKLHEVIKYYSLTGHTVEPCLLLASKQQFDKLPKDVQDKIRQAARESMKYCREVSTAQAEASLKLMKEKGIQVNEVDKEAFRKATREVYEKFKKVYGEQLVSEIEKVV